MIVPHISHTMYMILHLLHIECREYMCIYIGIWLYHIFHVQCIWFYTYCVLYVVSVYIYIYRYMIVPHIPRTMYMILHLLRIVCGECVYIYIQVYECTTYFAYNVYDFTPIAYWMSWVYVYIYRYMSAPHIPRTMYMILHLLHIEYREYMCMYIGIRVYHIFRIQCIWLYMYTYCILYIVSICNNHHYIQ